MFYKPDGAGELSKAEVDAVRSGFTRLLVKRRFHPEFVFKHCDELLATAHAEYVRYTGKGAQIEDSVAWMIHCAWRRLQNVLSASSSRPAELSSEVLAELVDEATPTPAQVAEDADRVRKVHRAIAKLDPAQRQVVALMYFEDMPLAEAARRLGWHESKARRCHEAAMKRLYRSLAVKSSDQLAAEVGLVAWLSFVGSASAFHLPVGLEGAFDKANEGANGLWARAHELARRLVLGGGGDTATVLTTSGTGRAAGACATVAVACVVGASGIVGPGVDGIGLFDDRTPPSAANSRRSGSDVLDGRQEGADPSTSDVAGGAGGNSANAAGSNGESTSANTTQGEGRQVKQQTDGLARAEGGSSASSTASSTATHTSAIDKPTHEETQTQQQFGTFR